MRMDLKQGSQVEIEPLETPEMAPDQKVGVAGLIRFIAEKDAEAVRQIGELTDETSRFDSSFEQRIEQLLEIARIQGQRSSYHEIVARIQQGE